MVPTGPGREQDSRRHRCQRVDHGVVDRRERETGALDVVPHPPLRGDEHVVACAESRVAERRERQHVTGASKVLSRIRMEPSHRSACDRPVRLTRDGAFGYPHSPELTSPAGRRESAHDAFEPDYAHTGRSTWQCVPRCAGSSWCA